MDQEGLSPEFSEAFEKILREAMEKKGQEMSVEEARGVFAKDMAATAWDLYTSFLNVGFEDEAAVAFTDTILAKLMDVRRLL